MAKNQQEKDFTLYDNLLWPIVVVDKKKRVEYFNHSFVTFSKLPPRVLKKVQKLSELIDCQQNSIDKLIDSCLSESKTTLSEEVEISIIKAENASYHAVMKFVPVDGYAVICFNDLSVEKVLYDKYKDQVEELKRTYAQIIQADKLSTMGELTVGISHEINNPLTIASGSVEVMEICLQEGELEKNRETLQNSLWDLRDSISRIHAIIKNMNSFIHQSEDKKEYCKLEELIDKSIELITPFFNDAGVTISKFIKAQDIVGLVNKIKIEQVLVNLCKNALDSIVEGNVKNGRVLITLDKEPQGGYVNISVEDNGPGVKKEIAEDIFTPFTTTKKIGDGTGLGLSICTKILEGHQGKLIFDSKEDVGATFTVKLPKIEVSSYANNDKVLSGSTDKAGKKVLVVDNEVQVLNILSKFFEDSEYVFIGSSNGQEALEVLNSIPVDMIITDYGMPEMNGSEFAEQVRKQKLSCPLLYMTSAKNLEKFQEDKDKFGVTGLILKPFTKEEVLKTIKLALKEG